MLIRFFSAKILLFTTLAYGAQQATNLENKTFTIPQQILTNQDLYDETLKTFKKINGQNFYAAKSNSELNDFTLILNNTFDLDQNLSLPNLQISTPDFNDAFTVKRQKGYSILNQEFTEAIFIPFIITANTQNANANNNKLLLENGELSSEIYFKPFSTNPPIPKALNSQDAYNFIISAALVQNSGLALHNQTVVNTHVNMGANEDEFVSLNGAPYILGAMGINADTNFNTLLLDKNAQIDIHAGNFKRDYFENNIESDRVTNLIGGFSINANSRNNRVIFNGAQLTTHGSSAAYFANSGAQIAGGYVDVTNDNIYNASDNILEINELNLALKPNQTLAYASVFVGKFWGGKTLQGDASQNKIYIKNLQSLKEYSDNVFIQGAFGFYGGESDKGEANRNEVYINLKDALYAHDNFTGENIFGFYGGYATKGANANIVRVENDLTQLNIAQNYRDRINIAAAKTLGGKANFNEVHIQNSLSSLPLYIHGVQKAEFKTQNFFADEANNNIITLKNLVSSRNLSVLNEGQICNGNLISYENVQSLSEASTTMHGSRTIIKGEKIANSNLITMNNYSSASRFNEHYIIAENESAYNNVFINQIAIGTASDKREGIVNIIAGLSKNSHHNTLSITDLNIDEYKNNDAIFIAPSALNLQENAKSHDNILYLGGEFNTFENSFVDAVSGTLMYSVEDLNVKLNIAPSLQDFSKNNRLILDTTARAKVVNNFDHFAFIISDMTMFDSALLQAKDLPINLSRNGTLQIFFKDGFKVKKGEKISLIKSAYGFVDENGVIIDSALNFKEMFKKLQNNEDHYNYKKFKNLENHKLKNAKFDLEISPDFTEIYAIIK